VSVFLGDCGSDDDLDEYLGIGRCASEFQRDFGFAIYPPAGPEAVVQEEPTPVREILSGFSWAENWLGPVATALEAANCPNVRAAVVFHALAYDPSQYANLNNTGPFRFVGWLDLKTGLWFSPLGTKATRRRFEYTDGTSNKFWEIAVGNDSHTVCYGRIGTDGTLRTKQFSSTDEAARSADALIREKLKKGYVEKHQSTSSYAKKAAGEQKQRATAVEDKRLRNKVVREIWRKAETGDPEKVRSYLAKHSLSVDVLDADGWTALGIACARGMVQAVETLADLGASVDKAGRGVPLRIAGVRHEDDVIRALIARGANVNPNFPKTGEPLLHGICEYGTPAAVHALLRAGANPNSVDARGTTPLMAAARGTGPDRETESVSIMRLLVKYGAKVGVCNEKGETALDIAVALEQKLLTKFLRGLRAAKSGRREARLGGTSRTHSRRIHV
jgi:predicted DNA-binding WGR domain protein